MKWKLLTVGKPSLDYARRGVAEYEKRLTRYVKLERVTVKERGQETNSRAQAEQLSDCDRVIVLDERGVDLTTAQLAAQIDQWELAGTKRVALVIGGADGHTDEMRERGDPLLRLSRMTMQHELALVVLLEQLYRAYTVKRGEPYHR